MVAKFISAFFAAFVLLKSYDEFRQHREPLIVFLFWLVTWGTVLVVAFFPQVTEFARDRIFGPNTGLGTIFGIAVVFLLFLSYRLYLKADRVERDVNQLISELALKDAEKKPSPTDRPDQA